MLEQRANLTLLRLDASVRKRRIDAFCDLHERRQFASRRKVELRMDVLVPHQFGDDLIATARL